MIRRRFQTRRTLALVVGAAASLSLGGCGSYRMQPTPGMLALGSSNTRVLNRGAITNNTNMRALFDDWFGAVWMFDRPSRLHAGPSPY